MLKDIDLKEISEDTKAVVIKLNGEHMHDESYIKHLEMISNQFKTIGVKALFVDNSIEIEELTDEMLSCRNLKTFSS